MKIRIIKFISLFSILFIILFSFTLSNYASSNAYKITSYFTFTSDMNINEGFKKIESYILLKNGKPSSDSFTFTYLKMHNNQYSYKETFSDNEAYSIIAFIKIIDSKYGTYVEAESADVDYQVLVATNLKPGATLNDCLEETWKSRWVNRTDPTWNSPNTGTQSYLETPYTTGAGESKTLIYNAKIDTKAYNSKPSETPSNGGSSSGDNNQGSTTDPNENNPEGSGNGQSNSNNNKKLDPVMIVLITISSIFGLILLFYIYKLIRMLVLWLQRK